MSFNWNLLVPWRYNTTRVDLRYVETSLLVHYHPEYVRRVLAWLHYKNGVLGPGSMWRAQQPGGTGYAPEGKSFHQNQTYNDGFVGACAIDLVKTNPGGIHVGVSWGDVLPQGSPEAAVWGLHNNVGKPGDPYPQGEPWHLQPIEIDGWQSWYNSGRPAPVPNYPIPSAHDPYQEETVKAARVRFNGTARQFVIRPVVSQTQLDVEGLRDSPIVTANISWAERQAIEAEFGPLA